MSNTCTCSTVYCYQRFSDSMECHNLFVSFKFIGLQEKQFSGKNSHHQHKPAIIVLKFVVFDALIIQ